MAKFQGYHKTQVNLDQLLGTMKLESGIQIMCLTQMKTVFPKFISSFISIKHWKNLLFPSSLLPYKRI